jgi:EcoRII C terminal/Restriction endonuclease EcoRII, N-terminal
VDTLTRLERWFADVSGDEWFWLAKRLSANDTGETGAHQVGLYIPRGFAFAIFPELTKHELNPRVDLAFTLDSHEQAGAPNLIYYNNRLITPGGTRDEARITAFGGKASALQDPESTASAVVLAIRRTNSGEMRGWLSTSAAEDELIETRVGELLPGVTVLRTRDDRGQMTLEAVTPAVPADCECSPAIGELPEAWRRDYPPGAALADEAIRRCECRGEVADRRLLRRVVCEYGLFRVVEDAIELPRIGAFTSVDAFTARALSVLNRRKARAGASLELHLARVFTEEEVGFDDHKVTENNNVPDFIFPSIAEYRARPVGDPRLRMLAVKTTCKDRWRQVLPEAEKIPRKHLFTLDTGISANQHAQMTAAGLTLVVPAQRVSDFPPGVRAQLITLEAFIALVRAAA